MSRTLRNTLVIAALLLIVAAAIFVPYRPKLVVGTKPHAGPYLLPKSIPGLRLHIFNTGMNRMSSLLVGAQRPWRPAPAFAIEHPKHGWLLFDTGLSRAVAERGEQALPIPMRWLFESRGHKQRVLAAQLAELGIERSAIRNIVLSHLHDDHTGGIVDFAKATLWGGPETASFATDHGLDSRFRELTFRDAAPLAPFARSFDLFGDGSVLLLHGGGHSHEDVMALLALESGPVLLAGDAVVHRDWLASNDVQRIPVDAQRAAEVRNQVRALLSARPDLLLIPGHDLSGLTRHADDVLIHHPEWLEPNMWPISD